MSTGVSRLSSLASTENTVPETLTVKVVVFVSEPAILHRYHRAAWCMLWKVLGLSVSCSTGAECARSCPLPACAGYESISVLSKHGGLAPLRIGFWRVAAPGQQPGYRPDALLCAVEPPAAHMLEVFVPPLRPQTLISTLNPD